MSFVPAAGARAADGNLGSRAPAVVIAHPRGSNVVAHAEASLTSPSVTVPAVWSLATVVPALSATTAREVFPVQRRRGRWTHVLLPGRPNGNNGWIRTKDLTFTTIQYRVEVILSERRITVRGPHGVIYEGSVAVGSIEDPTPPGSFFLRVQAAPPADMSFYGPQVIVLSAHSDAIESSNGGDASILIQGNNDATVLGQAVSHGNLRMDNDAITKLARALPVGTLVEIVA